MNQQGKLASASIISLVGVIVLLGISVFLFLDLQGIKSAGKIDISSQQNLASELLDNKLYQQAIAEYDKIIGSGKIDRKKESNLHYIVGNIYMNNLNDYQNAAARFVKAKVLSSDDDLLTKINKNLVVCFERMGRSLDAQRELDKMTLLEKPDEEKGTRIVVARIGKKEITMSSDGKHYVFPREDCTILPINAVTAENLAEYILDKLNEKIRWPENIRKIEIGVDEGIGQGARVEKDIS